MGSRRGRFQCIRRGRRSLSRSWGRRNQKDLGSVDPPSAYDLCGCDGRSPRTQQRGSHGDVSDAPHQGTTSCPSWILWGILRQEARYSVGMKRVAPPRPEGAKTCVFQCACRRNEVCTTLGYSRCSRMSISSSSAYDGPSAALLPAFAAICTRAPLL